MYLFVLLINILNGILPQQEAHFVKDATILCFFDLGFLLFLSPFLSFCFSLAGGTPGNIVPGPIMGGPTENLYSIANSLVPRDRWPTKKFPCPVRFRNR